MALEQISLFDFHDDPKKESENNTVLKNETHSDLHSAKKLLPPKNIFEENNIGNKKSEQVNEVVEDIVIAEEPVAEFELKSFTNKIAENPKQKGKRGRMKLSDMDKTVSMVDVPSDDVLFSRLYYPIGQVAGMFNVNISLIRFWEKEFTILKPKKNGKGDRLFRPEDIKNLKIIHHLLRERKYTIEGAKEFLKSNKKVTENFERIEQLQQIKSFLLELKATI